MRYGEAHKAQTRERLLHEASRAIRQDGPDKVAVAGLMSLLGLTHGGFYAHFKSKEHLVSEAIIYMFDERFRSFQDNMASAPARAALTTYIDRYLSIGHRDNIADGCPLAALSSDLRRLSIEQRAQLDLSIQRQIDGFSQVLEELKCDDPNSVAASLLAEMVGTLVISRIVFDNHASDIILSTAREQLKVRLKLV